MLLIPACVYQRPFRPLVRLAAGGLPVQAALPEQYPAAFPEEAAPASDLPFWALPCSA